MSGPPIINDAMPMYNQCHRFKYYSPSETIQAKIPYYEMYAQARHTASRIYRYNVFKLLSLFTKLQGLNRLVPTEMYIDPATKEWLIDRYGAECIVVGAGLLGCGGGGSPSVARLRVLQALRDEKRIRIIDPARYWLLLLYAVPGWLYQLFLVCL